MGDEETTELKNQYQEWLDLQKYSNRTTGEYIRYMGLFCEEETTQEWVEKFVRKNNNTVARAFLKSFKEWLDMDFKIPKVKGRIAERKIKYLSREELDKLVDGMPDPRYAVLVQLLFETGLRISEAFVLTPLNIDFKRLIIRGIGKGRKEYEVLISQEINDSLVAMTETMEEHERFWRMNKDSFRQYLTRHALLILGKRVHPHMIRHTTGTELRRAGVPLESIKEYLRHAKMDTTLIYAETTDKEKQVHDPVRKAIINE